VPNCFRIGWPLARFCGIARRSSVLDTGKKIQFLVLTFSKWNDDHVFVELLLDWMNEAVVCGFYAPPEPSSPDKSSVDSSMGGGSVDSAGSQVSSISVDVAKAERFSSIINFLELDVAQKFENTVKKIASTTDGWENSSGFIDGVLSAVQELPVHTTHAVVRDEMIEWFRKEENLEKKFAFLKEILCGSKQHALHLL